MYNKALLFNDLKTAKKILYTTNPSKIKALGREVENFDEKEWDQHKYNIVYQGNKYKFTQNPKLLEILLKTGTKTLVEASPYDKVWGIGLSENDPKARNRESWRGQNLLGEILTN